jgi:hypothetical protein
MTLKTREDELEAWWNELAHKRPFYLFCSNALSSARGHEHAGRGHEHAGALHQVCQLHSSVAHPWSEEPQGTNWDSDQFELAAEFGVEHEDPGRARRMVVAAMKRRGYEDMLVHDAALILTELASNAVVHAGSAFSISISSAGSVLRIAVGDTTPLAAMPADQRLTPRPGRGLGLIEAVSTRWGTAALAGGKIVWAELEVDRHQGTSAEARG